MSATGAAFRAPEQGARAAVAAAVGAATGGAGFGSLALGNTSLFGSLHHRCRSLPLVDQFFEILLDRPSLQMLVGELVAISPQASIATRILITTTITSHSLQCRF